MAWGFLGGSDGKEYAYNAGDPGPKIPWGRKWLPTPVFLSEEFHGQRSLVSYCPQGGKELDATEHARIHPGVKLLGHMVSKRRVKKLA